MPERPQARDAHTAELSRGETPPLGASIRIFGARASPDAVRLLPGAPPCIVGAGVGATVIVDDPQVSRTHLELSLAPEGVAARDLGSRNGTFYLGQRVEQMVLAFGSRLRIGGAEVAVEPDISSLEAAAGALHAPAGYRGLVGASPAMVRLFAVLSRLEGSLVNVLVEGESGVGKEVVARAIHDGSRVAGGPFVAVNGGGLNRELVQSELFGHKRGAFTGAVEAREGAFEAAEGGTLFLDEVGELPLDVQPVLLRALELGEVKRIGENQPRRVRVRLLAATNQNLEDAVREGRFRDDLYYRLAVVRLFVPPLRERPEDIEVLARRFAHEAGMPGVSDELAGRLAGQRFPGNVRELRNLVQAYAAVGSLPAQAPGGVLEAVLRRVVDASRPYQEQKEALGELFSRAYFEALIEKTGGNQSEAARVSGIERSYLGKLLVKYGVKTRPKAG